MTELTGARWSSAARCARMAWYEVMGAFPEALPERIQGLYERGKDVEDAYFRRLGETYSGRVSRQHVVPWGDGWEAHVDGVFLDEPERDHVEVKSTVSIDHLPGTPVEQDGVKTTSAVLQIVGGTHFDREGGAARIVTVSPVDYAEKAWPITMNGDLTGLADETAERVVHAAESGVAPPRCCKRPQEALGRMCHFASICFQDYEEPDPIRLDGEIAELAKELESLEDALKETGVDQKAIKTSREAVRAEIRAHLPGPGDYTAGGVHIRLSAVKGRESFSVKDAIAAGVLTAEEAEPFIRRGDEGERWAISKEDS